MELGRGGTKGQEEGKEREGEMQEKTLNGCFSSCTYKLRFDSQKNFTSSKEGKGRRESGNLENNLNQVSNLCTFFLLPQPLS